MIIVTNIGQIITFHYKNECSIRSTFRALRNFYCPFYFTIRRLVDKFESTNSINESKVCKNTAAVNEYMQNNPRQSIPPRA